MLALTPCSPKTRRISHAQLKTVALASRPAALEASSGCGKRLCFANNPEVRPSVPKANADLIDLIGTAKAMPFQN